MLGEAVACALREDSDPLAVFSAISAIRNAAAECNGDPTPLFENGVVLACAQAVGVSSWMTFDEAILDVVEMFTLEGFVSKSEERSYAAIFNFCCRLCSDEYTQRVRWRALSLVTEAIRPGAPGRSFYLKHRERRGFERIVGLGPSASTTVRRRAYLEYCTFHLEGRDEDADCFVEHGGVKAVSRTVQRAACLRPLCDRLMLACCAGLKDVDEMEHQKTVFPL